MVEINNRLNQKLMDIDIKVTHLGEDYGIVELDGKDYQVSLAFAEALYEALKNEDA